MNAEDQLFQKRCTELSDEVAHVCHERPKDEVLCVIVGYLAAMAKAFGISRKSIIDMFDSAQENMSNGS